MTSPYQLLSHTRPGKKRKFSPFPANQDRVLVREFDPGETGQLQAAALVAVADGVSRCPDGGAVAQWIIHEKLEKEILFLHPELDPGAQLRARLREFHAEFLERFHDDVLMLGSGCTLSVALVCGSRATVLWSGDSPVYHLRGGAQRGTVTAQGLIVPDKEPFSGALTDCFSGVTAFSVRQRELRLQPGDVVVAVTDGVALSGDGLASSLANQGVCESWVHAVCQQSYDMPGSDDISLAAVQWLGLHRVD